MYFADRVSRAMIERVISHFQLFLQPYLLVMLQMSTYLEISCFKAKSKPFSFEKCQCETSQRFLNIDTSKEQVQ